MPIRHRLAGMALFITFILAGLCLFAEKRPPAAFGRSKRSYLWPRRMAGAIPDYAAAAEKQPGSTATASITPKRNTER